MIQLDRKAGQLYSCVFFFQAEDGIRDLTVTGVQTCALPILPLMAENNPRVLFERMFGASDSTDARVRAARLKQDRSLLDSVNDRVNQLQKKLGRADNRKVNDYLASLRDVERRIQKAEEQSSKEVPAVAQPAGIPDGFDPHVRLLYDLQLLAYQSDL